MKTTRKREWLDLGSDVNWIDHGGIWGRPDPNWPANWQVVEFINPEDEGGTGYIVRSHNVELAHQDMAQALNCAGVNDSNRDLEQDPVTDPERARAIVRYWGMHLGGDEYTGNNARKLLRQAGMHGKVAA